MSSNHWVKNVNRTQRVMTSAFVACLILVLSVIVFTSLSRKLRPSDWSMLPLLIATAIAVYPYIQVARRTGSGVTERGAVTARNMRNIIPSINSTNKYDVLSSARSPMHPIYILSLIHI